MLDRIAIWPKQRKS